MQALSQKLSSLSRITCIKKRFQQEDKLKNVMDKGNKCKRLRVYTIVDFSFIRTFAPSF